MFNSTTNDLLAEIRDALQNGSGNGGTAYNKVEFVKLDAYGTIIFDADKYHSIEYMPNTQANGYTMRITTDGVSDYFLLNVPLKITATQTIAQEVKIKNLTNSTLVFMLIS